MADLYGDRAIQEAIERLAEAMASQDPRLDRQEVQDVLRGYVEDLMTDPGEGEPPEAVEPPPPGPPPDAEAPA